MLEGTIVVTVLVLELSLPWIQATCCVIDKAWDLEVHALLGKELG